MEEKETLKIIDENGEEKEVEVLSFFTLKSNGKDYLIYTENEEDADGNVITYASEVDEKEDGENVELKGITDEAVLKEVQEYMLKILKDGE
jgi:uncharacterized protein YrzB (UPF0473 family)